jgi:FPC/CPF motif-containing protein YcgG
MNKLQTSTRALGALKDGFVARFKAFVASPRFPCVGAKSAMNRGRMRFGLYDTLSGADAVRTLCEQLADFSDQYPQPGSDPVSYVAMFRDPVANEDEFHHRLWSHLQAMHDIDAESHPWDGAVSSDVGDPRFSFSIASRAFFVVGLHPRSSRMARRAPFPCLVFNFHDQFESMRQDGRYTKLQDAIRARDVALQGAINPVLARFGEASEAHQYSGRAHADADAVCFAARQAA